MSLARYEIPVPEAGRTFVFRRPTNAEYAEYYEQTRQRPRDARRNLLLRVLDQPGDAQALVELLDRVPGYDGPLANALEEVLGAGRVIREPLTTEALRASKLPAGDVAVIEELATKARPGDLVLVRVERIEPDEGEGPIFSCVLGRPSGMVYRGLREKPTADAVTSAALSCLRWPSVEVARQLFAELPAVPLSFLPLMFELGGAFLEVRAKKL